MRAPAKLITWRGGGSGSARGLDGSVLLSVLIKTPRLYKKPNIPAPSQPQSMARCHEFPRDPLDCLSFPRYQRSKEVS